MTTEERFWCKVKKTSECWEWTGYKNSKGYGMFRLGTEHKFKHCVSHRYSYELLASKIPKGLQLDHLCRVRHCVNPKHLEPVTARENTVRGLATLNRKNGLPVGVRRVGSKYEARKSLYGKAHTIGRFATVEDAHVAYQTAAIYNNN